MKKILFVFLFMPLLTVAQTKKKPVMKSASPNSSVQQSVSRGKLVYDVFCLSCHQTDGSGVPNMNPPLIQNDWVLGPKNRLIEQILQGSQGKVEIDGETFHNTMPPMGHLTDQQIADVLTYVRKSFGNKASNVSPAEVKSLRSKTK